MALPQHLQTLTILSLLTRVLIAALVVSSTYLLTSFDSSPRLVLSSTTPPWISSLLRWDAFHFAHVAQNGHGYEHAWAFFPALPFIMRASGYLLSRAGLSSPDVVTQLVGGAVLAALFDSTRVLYRLSLYHLRSPSAAFLAAALSLLSSSPTTLRFAPYTEPFFTYCSYRGMWACACSRWFSASVWFALASAFRSNGILLSGFILWGMLVTPYLSARKDLVSVHVRAFGELMIRQPPVLVYARSDIVLHCSHRDSLHPVRASQLQGICPLLYFHGASGMVRPGLISLDICARPKYILERRLPPVLDGVQHTQLCPRPARLVERLCVLRVLSLSIAPHIPAPVCALRRLAPH